MEFESPDVMKDFPGLYGSESGKKSSNDQEYSDDPDKLAKKDILGKRKDKKEKEKGYAALEGESSAEENETKSPSKIKKTKAFKFSTKSKEKREKSKEKELVEKKKDKKSDKKIEKEKIKTDKKEKKDHGDIADELPIFGVALDLAVERSRCHDGVNIPLPVRNCIDHIQSVGLGVEGVYKISGTKSKVIQIRKLYNQRTLINFAEYDIPTVTSVLKVFLRDLPEPILTSEMLVRFEEAGAILNIGTREKHLKTVTENLPPNNKLLLSWLLIHFDNVTLNERLNKMNMQHFVPVLSPVLHISQRLLTALLHHCRALFPTIILDFYIPPLTSTTQLRDDLESLEIELKKQESLLCQIHSEINSGYIFKTREELLWEVQRVITQIKRKIKNLHKDVRSDEKKSSETLPGVHSQQIHSAPQDHVPLEQYKQEITGTIGNAVVYADFEQSVQKKIDHNKHVLAESEKPYSDVSITLLKVKNIALMNLKDRLINEIDAERNDIENLRTQLHQTSTRTNILINDSESLDESMDLLHKENQILQIKKINLVREIMEQEELCIDIKTKISLFDN